MNEFLILDVAHGNSSLLLSNSECAVFDAAPKDTLLATLSKYGITTIDYVFISHSDQDHIGGLCNLLLNKNIKINNLFINPDATKTGNQMRRLRIIIEDAAKRNNLKINVIHTNSSINLIGEVKVEVLSPTISTFLAGPSGVDKNKNPITSNSSSSVLRLLHHNHPIVLLTADINHNILNHLITEKVSQLPADILLFPHHGGSCSVDNVTFTEELISKVKPKFTVFSFGRDKFSNPRPDIVNTIKASSPTTCIICTQLSTNCLKFLPASRSHWADHLNDLPRSGKVNIESCAGSIKVSLDGKNTIYPDLSNHKSFVSKNIPTALCI